MVRLAQSSEGNRDQVLFNVPDPNETRIFVVDDETSITSAIDRFLSRLGYEVEAYEDPTSALSALKEEPPRLLLTDEGMPGISGLELARRAQEVDPDIAIIVMTGGGGEAKAAEFLRLGASDYLIKPIEQDVLEASVRSAVLRRAEAEYRWQMRAWLNTELENQARVVQEVSIGALGALVNALEARNDYFRGHSNSVAVASAGIARALDLPASDVEEVRAAGLLHDVGMIAVPDRIVEKPHDLTNEEYEELKQHCEKGAEILQPLSHLGPAIEYVSQHHERIDGSGYPKGLRGDEISLGGQILGLAEAWTAVLETRPYRAGLSRPEALATIEQRTGTWFDPELILALRKAEGFA